MREMAKPIKLIIADDEPFICGMLEKLIDFEALGLTLIDCVNDGETLEARIEEMRPDIVLTDISMPRQDGLDVIRKTRERGNACRFVIISGYRQFEYAYNALKYDVDDYLLKPVEKTELNRVLRKICDEIRNISSSDGDTEILRLHAYLIEEGIHKELRSDSLSLEEINRTFKTNFRNGCFRFAMMKLDFTRDEKQRMEDVSSVVNKMRSIGSQGLQTCCAEVICSEQRDRVVFLLNYDAAAEGTIKTCLTDIYSMAKHVIELFHGFNLTLCVGKPVQRLCYAQSARNSCRRAMWLRMHYGINRVIFEETVEDVKINGFQKLIDDIRGALEKAYVSMDEASAQLQFHQFFVLPVPVLCGTEAMDFLYGQISYLCQRFGEITRDPSKTKSTMAGIIEELEMQTTFQSCCTVLSRDVSKLLSQMAEFVRDKNAKPVLRATAYIETHYAEHITLETMADLVNLNPIYFSNLFKREVGKSFTEYLTEYRMKKAKELLRGSDMNINEIADALGYSDARYFSKVFKKEIGIKPTDYRKIYG